MRLPVEDRRRLLIDAALEVVKRDGVARASTRAIVEQAGMPLGSFHFAFTSRDELLGAVIERVAQADRLATEPALAHATPGRAGLEALLLEGIVRFIDYLESDPYAELAFLELTLHGARQDLDDKKDRDRYSVTYTTPEYLLAKAASATSMSWNVPLREVARLMVGALDGLTVAWLADHDSHAARRAATFHAQALAGLAGPAGPAGLAGLAGPAPQNHVKES